MKNKNVDTVFVGNCGNVTTIFIYMEEEFIRFMNLVKKLYRRQTDAKKYEIRFPCRDATKKVYNILKAELGFKSGEELFLYLAWKAGYKDVIDKVYREKYGITIDRWRWFI